MAELRGWRGRRGAGGARRPCHGRGDKSKRAALPAPRWSQVGRSGRVGWLLALLALALLLVAVGVASRLGMGGADPSSTGKRVVRDSSDSRVAETGDAGNGTHATTEGLDSVLEGLAGSLGDVSEALPPDAEMAPELADLPVRREESVVGEDVVGTARDVLERYQRQGGVLLAHAGWLDLQGRSWGCVASGGEWVEVCLVTWRSEAESVLVRMRMEAEEWERAYGTEREGN